MTEVRRIPFEAESCCCHFIAMGLGLTLLLILTRGGW
jgi:hypothetical protein